MKPLDVSGLPGKEAPYYFVGSLVDKKHLDILTDDKHAGSTVLTDDYAPVENLLKYVVNRWK